MWRNVGEGMLRGVEILCHILFIYEVFFFFHFQSSKMKVIITYKK